MKITRIEKLTNEKWLNLFAANFRNHDHTGRWVFASRKDKPHKGPKRPDAVVIVPTLIRSRKRSALVLVKEFRVPIGTYVYGFPAGLIERGESVEETARREIVEETGLEITKIKRVSPALYSSSGLTDESATVVFADVRSSPNLKQSLDGGEELEVVTWDYPTVRRMCTHPDAGMDTKVWMALHLCVQLGRLV